MTEYRYLLTQLTTGQVLAELPLSGVSFTQQINSAGTFNGGMLLTDAKSVALNALNASTPAATGLFVDRNGVLIWGGPVWGRKYNSTKQMVDLTAQEFESIFAHRRINATNAYTAVDQLTLAQTLVTQMQAVTGGNLNIQVTGAVSGVTVNRTYYSYELKSVLSALQDLATSTTGFDFNVKPSYDGGGNIVITFQVGYPRLGKAYSSSNANAPVFELGSNIVEYEYFEDGAQVANTVYTLGAGSNEGKLISTASDTTKYTAGYPLLETSTNYTDVNDSTMLSNFAAGQLKAVSTPPVILKIIANPSIDPQFGNYGLGDDVRVRIADARFPNGLDATYRIMALSVQPGENNQPERISLSLTVPQV